MKQNNGTSKLVLAVPWKQWNITIGAACAIFGMEWSEQEKRTAQIQLRKIHDKKQSTNINLPEQRGRDHGIWGRQARPRTGSALPTFAISSGTVWVATATQLPSRLPLPLPPPSPARVAYQEERGAERRWTTAQRTLLRSVTAPRLPEMGKKKLGKLEFWKVSETGGSGSLLTIRGMVADWLELWSSKIVVSR